MTLTDQNLKDLQEQAENLFTEAKRLQGAVNLSSEQSEYLEEIQVKAWMICETVKDMPRVDNEALPCVADSFQAGE